MSIVYCHQCDRNIDTDFEAEHWQDVHGGAVDYQRYFETLNRQIQRIVNHSRERALATESADEVMLIARETIADLQQLAADTAAFAEKLELENAVHALDKFAPRPRK